MTITDNLVIKVKAESGQAVITDSLSAATFSGAGTATLVNDGTYGYLWRITGGALTAALSGMGNWTETSPKTTTLAARFRVTNRAANYTRFIQIGTDASNGIFFGNAGTTTGNLRGGAAIAGTAPSTPATTTYTTGDVVTIVMTFTETNAASDPLALWKGTTGRSGTTADATSSVAVSTAARSIAAAVLTVATETLDLLNLAYWTRGLSDAEAASIADDISQLWGGVNGSSAGANLAGTSSLSAGTAQGGSSGTFTSDAMENNTGAGLLANTPVFWTWYQGAIGSAPTSTTHGSGTTNAAGILTVNGLPSGAGFLLVRTADSAGVYYQPGTIA